MSASKARPAPPACRRFPGPGPDNWSPKPTAPYDQWTYHYGRGENNSAKTRFKLLQIRFDQAGKLASYNWSGDMSGAAPVDDNGKTR
jgi:hypothetical protein